MAHYAFLDENNIVTEVIVGNDENNTEELPEGFTSWEQWYGDFRGQTCKRTSYNTAANEHKLGGTPFRGNFAGIGWTYDSTRDAFISPQPYDSWVLDEDDLGWYPPVSYPDDDNLYIWNESSQSWDLVS